MNFADYPQHLRRQWEEIQESWNRAMDRRGRRRQEAVDDVRDWLMGKMHGLELRNKRDREYWEVESWKSEEYKRAERCTESLIDATDKIEAQKIAMIANENEISAMKNQISELEEQIAAWKPMTQEKAGVNLQKASTGLI